MLAVAPYEPSGGSGDRGGEVSVRLIEMADPAPGPNEILIEVAASALNQADLLQMRGLYPPPAGESLVPGLECAGTVLALGPGAARFAVGDRVMALLAGGGHGSLVAVPEGQVMAAPDGMSFTDAAALPEAGLTSWTNLVYEGRLARGQSVLITAAASGVGTFAVQLARARGARVLVAGRSLNRLERLKPLGAEHAFALGEGLGDAVRKASDGGVDLVIDLVGGDGLNELFAALRDRGTLVLVGLLGGVAARLDLGAILRRRLVLRGSVLRGRDRGEKAGLVASFAQEVGPLLETGEVRPMVDRVLSFAEIERAYRELGAGGVLGKIVVEMG